MASYQTLLREYQEYIEEKKALAALAGTAAIAAGGAHFMNKDASAAQPTVNQTSQDPIWSDGDWAYDSGGVATPTDHPEDGSEPEKPAAKAATPSFTKADLDTLTMTMWGEARGEGAAGMKAVAHVIVNRAKHDRWASTVRGVAREDSQFSCWNSNDVNSKLMPKMQQYYDYLKAKPEGWEQWYEKFKASSDFPGFQKYLEARRIARDVLMGKGRDPTNGALFYHTGAVSPNWAVGQKVVAKIGDHQFYRTDRKA